MMKNNALTMRLFAFILVMSLIFSALPMSATKASKLATGHIAGLIQGFEACDVNPTALPGATIEFHQAGELVSTHEASAIGTYVIEIEAGVYDVHYKHTGFAPKVVEDVEIEAGGARTINADLRILKACLVVEPEALEHTQPMNTTGSQTLTIRNTGAAATAFELVEVPGTPPQPANSSPQPANIAMSPSNLDGMDWSKQAPENIPPAPKSMPQADTLLDESFENGFPPEGWTHVENSWWTWETNTQNPHSGTTFINVPYATDLSTQSEWIISPKLNLSAGLLKFWSFGSLLWCKVDHDNCDLNVWLLYGEPDVNDPANILVGKGDDAWTANWVWSESTFDLTSKLTGEPVRIAFQYTGTDGAQIALDTITLAGAELSDVEWLSEDPVSGTIGVFETVTIQVNYDTNSLDIGDYFASLVVKQNNGPLRTAPVTLHVIEGEDPGPEPFMLYLPLAITK